MTDVPSTPERIAYIAHQADELRQMGAIVHMGTDPLPPGLIGTLSQVLPDGPMMVWIDATKSLHYQLSMLRLALEFLVIEPDADWVIDELTVDGEVVRRRSISMRVEG